MLMSKKEACDDKILFFAWAIHVNLEAFKKFKKCSMNDSVEVSPIADKCGYELLQKMILWTVCKCNSLHDASIIKKHLML